ncbi:MAG: PQQ-binding-like beta-propeller repeat protein [Planctomycetota bacterium]|nr:PQQ-binding-like beta-propeller repeat protein [Planctomycetota bacterium]
MVSKFAIAALVLSLVPGLAAADDWPTYLGDHARSGRAAEEVRPPLSLVWTFRPVAPPDPAWTVPAKEAARVGFDDAYHAIVAEGRVYFGSSGDNKVYALDAATGRPLWTVFTGGPVRLSPTYSEGRLYFGSDDGFAYCLRAETGELVWRTRAAHRSDRIIGHGRMISLWPVRTGVLVSDGVAYFGAGIFPSESVFICAADARSGEILWRNDTVGERGPEQRYDGISPQGYLLASSDTLFVPSGRSMPAAFRRSDGKFLYYLNPAGKVGGNYSLLVGDDLIAGVNEQRVYDLKSGKRKGGGYAWAAVNRLVVDGDTSYSLTDHELFALDMAKVAVVRKERDEVAGKRDKRQRDLRNLYRSRYRLDDQDPEYRKKYDELSRKIDTSLEEIAKITDEQRQLEDQAYRWKRDNDCRDSMILAGKVLFAGGEDRVVAVDASTGKWLWTGDVDGRASGLAAAGGRLVVSTTRGTIHCFREGEPRHVGDRVSPEVRQAPFPEDEWSDVYRRAAARIVSETGVRRGFCLVLGCGDGRLALELARTTELTIYGVDPRPERVRRARRAIDAAGLYGSRVTIDLGSLADLPYPTYFANLIVSDELLRSGRLEASPDELLRVLRPAGGIAFLGRPEGTEGIAPPLDERQLTDWLRRGGVPEPELLRSRGVWAKVTRGTLEGAGSWTHLYADPANTANSRDELVRTPLGLLWFGRPGPERMVERHARAAAPISLDGRLFVEGENVVMAFDAYNGRQLWEREIPGAVRVRVDVDGSNFAVTAQGLFVATRSRALRLDPQSGETLRVYETPSGARWGYLSSVDTILFGSTAKPLDSEYGARWKNVSEDPVDNRRAYQRFNAGGGMWRSMQKWPDWGREDTWKGALTQRMITSDSVFSLDVETGKQLWVHRGKITPTSISIGDGKIFFTDSNVTDEEKKTAVNERRKRHGRLTYEEGEGSDHGDYDVRKVVALDVRTGDLLWTQLLDLTGAGGNRLGTSYRQGRLFLFGHFSNHDRGPFETGKLKWRRITTLSAADGYVLWSRELNYLRRPLLMGDHLIVEPRAVSVENGEFKRRTHPVSGESVFWEFKRGGHSCGVTTASLATFFFRSDSINYYDFQRDHGMLPIGGTRAGCWINMITANGLALLPEASAGCTCSFPIRTTMVLAPRKVDRKWTIYASPGSLTPVRHWHLNLGAPGDRKDSEGRVWFGYPRLGVGYGMKFSLKEKVESGPGFFARSFEGEPIAGTDRPWVFSSGVEGKVSCELPLLDEGQGPATYRVRLGFSEHRHEEPGRRRFDVRLQGKVVLQDFDIVETAGGKNTAVTREFPDVEVKDVLRIELSTSSGAEKGSPPLLNSIEVTRS